MYQRVWFILMVVPKYKKVQEYTLIRDLSRSKWKIYIEVRKEGKGKEDCDRIKFRSCIKSKPFPKIDKEDQEGEIEQET